METRDLLAISMAGSCTILVLRCAENNAMMLREARPDSRHEEQSPANVVIGCSSADGRPQEQRHSRCTLNGPGSEKNDASTG
jgi:hypothetical protein